MEGGAPGRYAFDMETSAVACIYQALAQEYGSQKHSQRFGVAR